MLTIEKQLKDQYTFNKVLLNDLGYDIDNLSEEELNELLVTMVIHLVEEGHEILRELNWKIHKRHTKKSLNRENIIGELVDVSKFLTNFLTYMKVTPKEFTTAWDKKTKIVEERYKLDKGAK